MHFPNGLRTDILKKEDILLLKEAGLKSVSIAVETASERLQKMIRKNLDLKTVTENIETFVKAGIYTQGFFMIGFPTETYKEAWTTVKYACQSPLHRAWFFIPVPFEGSVMAKMVAEAQQKKYKILRFADLNYYNSRINISAMSDREMKKVFRCAYIRFYLNLKRIFKIIITHPQKRSFPRYVFLVLLKVLPKLGRSD